MKALCGSLVLGALLAGPVCAQGVAPQEVFVQDGEQSEAEIIEELEEQLNQLLVVDDAGRIVIREELRDSLPDGMPAERLQAMLSTFVQVGDEGRLEIRNPDQIRPYLPMIRRFLSQGGLERMQRLRDMEPEERSDALRRMMGPRNPGAEPEEAPESVGPGEEGIPGAGGGVERRLRRIEESQQRIERKLDELLEMQRNTPRSRLSAALERARVLGRGLRALGDVTEPEDMERVQRLVQRLGERMDPEDLQNPQGLMQTLQESMDPQDMGRFMEVFSDFVTTPEGRAFVEELETMAQDLESFMNSEEGQRMMERLQGQGGEMREQMDRLVQPEEQGGSAGPEGWRRRGSFEERHEGEGRGARRPRGSRLY